jgi:hypothetical protein
MLTMTIWVQQQSLLDKPNLRLVGSKVLTIVDSLEARSHTGEGAAIARLRKLEDALRAELKRQAEKEDTRGNS